MSITGTEITGRQITFCVREHEGQPVQHLTITPVGFLDYQDALCGADLVMVEIRLCILRSQIIVDDHVTVDTLMKLHEILLELQNGRVAAGTFGTTDGQLELSVQWRETAQDVRFAGRIPAFDFTELVNEPLRLRDAIYRTLSFQFAVESSALTGPIAQLKEILELLDSIKVAPEG